VPRRANSWLLLLPLLTAGSLLAHGLAYRLVQPDPGARAALLERTGHAYLGAVPFLLGALGALLAAGLLAAGLRALRGAAAAPAAWPLALVPPVAFALQEHLERLAAGSSFPLHLAASGTFLVGLALQLPFGLLAVLLARLLERAAAAVGSALCARPAPARACARVSAPALAAVGLRPCPLALGAALRAPPA
jgi:hypothetical protein